MSNRNNGLTALDIKLVSWEAERERLAQIRQQVFIVEQHVPPSLEWDDMDATALHFLAFNQHQQAIGCARIIPSPNRRTCSIGRMAVLVEWRNMGVGMALLQATIHHSQHLGWHEILLSAQTHAIGFYQRAGFSVCSEEYLDAGIPHRDMRLLPA